ncbi:MAG TPA: Flp family type IVb pilin [Candidatus Binataceae bacterium]|nr:Flp family type IVb pilin [Candidatus Binataceae bacterium]
MDYITRLYVRLAEGKIVRAGAKLTDGSGQTMTEYAMILSAIAVVVLSGYKTMGTKLTSLLTIVDNQL